MQQLQAAYIVAKRNKPKPRVFSDAIYTTNFDTRNEEI